MHSLSRFLIAIQCIFMFVIKACATYVTNFNGGTSNARFGIMINSHYDVILSPIYTLQVKIDSRVYH